MTAEFPEKLRFLFDPARYKVMYGGRGGMKSWGAAQALLVQGGIKPMRNLCAREFQSSIKESVHRLLSDRIQALELHDFYAIERDKIAGKNGTTFNFEGLKHNVARIKSYEGVDVAWVEEAESVSKDSWQTLVPTIRKDGSEIWVTFNPKLESDETYQRFVVNAPPNAKVIKIGWRDNPWFPQVLRDEKNHLMQVDYDAYLNVWEGHCRQILEGAVYANELRALESEGRVTSVPYDPAFPVHTFWDLGFSDSTSIWFVQRVGFEYRVIDFYENSGHALPHYQQVLQQRGYVYGIDYLPHDGRARQLGTGRSIEELLRSAGRTVYIVPSLSVADGINAARTIFATCYFDRSKCQDGLQSLRHYRYEKNEKLGTYNKEPRHDEFSHGADAWRMFGVAGNLMDRKKPVKKPDYQPQYSSPTAWMA